MDPLSHRTHYIVAGGAGFMGSHVVDHLLHKSPPPLVSCIDKLSYASGFSMRNLAHAQTQSNFQFHKVDLAKEREAVSDIVLSAARNSHHVTIVNLAAESCVDQSFDDPVFFTTNNILATQNLLEATRKVAEDPAAASVSFVHVSTDEVYGEQQESELVDEEGALCPSNPYAATKAACDLIIASYVKSFCLSVSILRSNNVYGPRQYPEKIVAVALDSLRHAGPDGLPPEHRIPIHGSGSNLRRYLHVADFARAVSVVEQRMRTTGVSGETYNVGTADELDNLSLVKKVCSIYMRTKFGREVNELSNFVRFGKDRRYNDARYSIDVSKLEALGWRQQVALEDGLTGLVNDIINENSNTQLEVNGNVAAY